MPNCKFCGKEVRSVVVYHGACWESQVNRVAQEFCDGYCRFPRECADQDELDAKCESCPIIKLANLGVAGGKG